MLPSLAMKIDLSVLGTWLQFQTFANPLNVLIRKDSD